MKEDSRLVRSCISGQIYDSDPIEFTTDLGARFALHPSILKMPGTSKLISLFAKGFTSSLDALFLTRFGSQRSEYWQTLYSSVVSFLTGFLFCKLCTWLLLYWVSWPSYLIDVFPVGFGCSLSCFMFGKWWCGPFCYCTYLCQGFTGFGW